MCLASLVIDLLVNLGGKQAVNYTRSMPLEGAMLLARVERSGFWKFCDSMIPHVAKYQVDENFQEKSVKYA